MHGVEQLNQVVRRLRHYQTESEWISAVLDGASAFVQRVAMFTIDDGYARLRAERGLDLNRNLSFSLASARAFQTAISSGDSVIALRTPAEVTETLSTAESSERVHIIPIENGPRIVALLFVVSEPDLDLSAIELIAGVASMVLERQSNKRLHTQLAAKAEEETSGVKYSGQLV
jgi:hypothetical protein